MKRKNENWKKCDDSFGYLMYVLNKKGFFSELHLPSFNKTKINGNDLIMEKKIPKQFRKRALEICQLIKSSKKTNLILLEKKEDKNHVYLITRSKIGMIKKSKELSLKNKKKIISLFFEYHKNINSKNIKIASKYNHFFNDKKFKKDISLLVTKVSVGESIFDKKVSTYLKLISNQNIKINSKKLKIQNVHGDFIPRNIVCIDRNFYLIDLDTAHRGYLEIQFIRLLKELFGFGTKEFFNQLKENKNNFELNQLLGGEMFYLYLLHKIRDLSMLKSTYFTNRKKYFELQDYMSSQIDFISSLISQKQYFFNLFNSKLN